MSLLTFLLLVRSVKSSQPPSPASLVFVDVDDTEHEAGHHEAGHTDVVTSAEIKPGNGHPEYQRYRLTQLDVAPRPAKVPRILYIL